MQRPAARVPVAPGEMIALAVIVMLAVACVRPGFAYPVNFDATHSYLPMARRVLEEGLAFFRRPESVSYAPVGYVWPAVFGAHELAIRWANVALYGAAIVASFFAVRSSHSARAGLIAALLLAVSPTLTPFIANVFTEPPFVFFMAVWIGAVAAVIRGHRVAGAIVGGLALTAAALTRPAVMYFPLLLGLVFAWRAYRATRRDEGRTDMWLAVLHLIGLAGCAAFIVRNAIVFGFPSVAAGAGVALFFGINPLVDGFDPNYYGLSYDDGAVTMGKGHLSIEGDRLLRRVALREIPEIPLLVFVEMGVRKAFAFVFVTSTMDPNVALMRLWRVLLVAFALPAVVFERRSRIVIALAALTAYMIAVHLPLLYVHRYSSGAIDLPLSLLAGIGFAGCMASLVRLAVVSFAAVIAGGIGLALMANPGPGSPHPERSHYEVVWSRDHIDAGRVEPHGAIEVPITGAPLFNPLGHFMLTMELLVKPQAHGATCNAIRLRYKGLDQPRYPDGRVVRIPIKADGSMRELRIGMAYPVYMDREGTLRLEFDCDSAADVRIGRVRVLSPDRALYYRRLVERESGSK